jgi:pilus assembly protein CpaE
MEIDDSVLEKAFHRLPCNVAVLVRPTRLEEAYEVTAEGISQMLSHARSLFPFIVVDLPRAFDPVTAAALTDADRVLIVAQLTVASIRNATRIQEWLRKMGTPENNIGVVLNRVSAGVGHITAQDVESHFGRPVFATVPNDYQRVQSSLDMGYSIVKDDPRNPVQLAIREMARKIGSDLLRQESQPEESATLLQRFWRRKIAEKAAPVGV